MAGREEAMGAHRWVVFGGRGVAKGCSWEAASEEAAQRLDWKGLCCMSRLEDCWSLVLGTDMLDTCALRLM